MRRRRRLLAALATLALLGCGAWWSWTWIQRRLLEWVGQEHVAGDYRVRVWGARFAGWRDLGADSIRVQGPSLDLLLQGVGIRVAPTPRRDGHVLPLAAEVAVRRADLSLRHGPSKEGPSRFPRTLRISARLQATLDTLVLRGADDVPGEGPLVVALGLSARTQGAAGAEARVRRLESRGIPAWASVQASADWGADSARAEAGIALWSGCCAHDSVHVKATASFEDLSRGRAEVSARVADLGAWSDVVPVLGRIPSVRDVEISAKAVRGAGIPEVSADLSFGSGAWLFLPDLRWKGNLYTDSARTSVRLAASGSGRNLTFELGAPAFAADLGGAWATGRATLSGVSWRLGHAVQSLDGTVRVDRLDRRGAAATVALASGSRVRGDAVWKGLGWNLEADIAPGEPWVEAWVPGKLVLAGGGSVRGRDSAGAASFHVVARRPAFSKLRGDSLVARVFLDAHHVDLPALELHDGARVWDGSGGVDWSARTWSGRIVPRGDEVGAGASGEGDFDGGVRVATTSFPLDGLPLDLPERVRLPWPARLTCDLLRRSTDEGSAEWLSATVKGKPAADSVFASVQLVHRDSLLEISDLQAGIGGGRLSGALRLVQGGRGWDLEALRADFDALDLRRLDGIWPGLPRLEGRLEGGVRTRRDSGVSADLRLRGLVLDRDGARTVVPDLSLWGSRDTLHLGGWFPAGSERAPFRLTATRLFSPEPTFSLLAFYGDVLRLRGEGSLRDRNRLRASFTVDGGLLVPGTSVRLSDLLVEGEARGATSGGRFNWSANVAGRRGRLQAIEGNPLDLAFLVRAEPGTVYLDSVRLQGPKSGLFDASGRYGLQDGSLALRGTARDFVFELGGDQKVSVGRMDLQAQPGQPIRMELSDAGYARRWTREERLDLHVSNSRLSLLQASDWRRLKGDVEVDRFRFTRNIGDVEALIRSARTSLSGDGAEAEAGSGGVPTLLDLRVYGKGDSLSVANNLLQSRIALNLQVTGPSSAPVLTGAVDGDAGDGTFGYASYQFGIDEMHMEWNASPLLQGNFVLKGHHDVLTSCDDVETTTSGSSVESSAEKCPIRFSSAGTLQEPRMHPLTSDCASEVGSDGVMEAALALQSGCYPSSTSQNDVQFGELVRSVGGAVGRNYINGVINRQLESQRRSGGLFLPDSFVLTDLPTGSAADQFGLLALYRLTPSLDAEGEYQHTFYQTSSTKSGAVLNDLYTLRLRYRIPFDWIPEDDVRARLQDRVVLKLEYGPDENDPLRTVLRPALGYRWEFW